MFIQLLFLFITQALANVHHQCGVDVTRPIFTYNGMKKQPGVNLFFHTFNSSNSFDFPEPDFNDTTSFSFPPQPVSELTLLIYKEADRKFTNIPDDFDKEDSWGSFGVCTEEDMKSKICTKLNSFKVEYKQNDVAAKIYNDIYVHDPNLSYSSYFESFNANAIKLANFGKYCYVYYLTDEQEPEKDIHVHTYLDINGKNLFDEISRDLISYYGRTMQIVSNFCLLLFIWLKKSKSIKESVKEEKIQYRTPYIYCIIMMLTSSITSIIRLFLIDIGIKSCFIPYEQQNFLERSNWSIVEYLMIFDSIFSLFLYICAYQFANLDKFGYKINYRKNKFTMILPFLMLFAALIHFFALDLSYKLIGPNFSKLTYEYRLVFYNIADYSFKVIDFLNFSAIWYVIYKISQEASTDLAYISDYASRFNKTRIWVVFVMIVLGASKILLDETLYILVYKMTEFVQTNFGYEEPSELLTNWILFCLKFILCFLHEFMFFVLPILSIIIIKIWWSYDPKSDEDSSIELSRV